MGRLDPRLRFLREQSTSQLLELEGLDRFGIEAAAAPDPVVRVLVKFDDSLAPLRQLGFVPTTIAGDVASGFAPLSKVKAMAELPNVTLVEGSRPLAKELNHSLIEARVDRLHSLTPPRKGAGVIVGIIDSGIDYTHRCFRKSSGSTRILAIWDQRLTPRPGESSPAGFNFGVEYTKADIDAALVSPTPFNIVRHRDRDDSGHGTHVTGIAAGNGQVAGNGNPAFTFVGVATEADIMVVANTTGANLGDSAATLDAVRYLMDKAASLGRPIVINLSQGDNLGPHDGTSLLERGIDNLLGNPGQAMIKSAGNAGADDIHARGTVPAGGSRAIPFTVPPGDVTPDTIDIWYQAGDLFNVSIRVPNGQVSAVISPDSSQIITLPNGNQAFIESTTADPFNGDNRIYIQLLPAAEGDIQPGSWAIILGGSQVFNGRFDAWIERGKPIPRFTGPLLNRECTITVPGTSAKIITVGAYVSLASSNGASLHDLCTFSSLGPTRNNSLKPDVSAPGEVVTSARAGAVGTAQYRALRGTSMAAPHVAGVIALLLEKDPTLTQDDIKNRLVANARADTLTNVTPNNRWGAGKLDAEACFNAV